MAAPLRPTSAPAYGKENWVIVMTIASTSFIPVAATEYGAAGSLDVTNILFADGTDKPSQETNTVDAVRRMGDTVTYGRVGTSKINGGTLTYMMDPQAATGSNGKKLYEKIPNGTAAYLVQRLGLDNSVTAAAGQFVNVYPVQFGPSLVGTAGDGEAAEGAATCTYVVTGPGAQSVAMT